MKKILFLAVILFHSHSIYSNDMLGFEFEVQGPFYSLKCSALSGDCIPYGTISDCRNFESPFAKLLYKVGRFEHAVQCPHLSNHSQLELTKELRELEILSLKEKEELESSIFLKKMENWSPFSTKKREQIDYLQSLSSRFQEGVIPSIAYIVNGLWVNNLPVIEKGILSFLQFSLWDYQYEFPLYDLDHSTKIGMELKKLLVEIKRIQLESKILPIFFARFESLINYLTTGKIDPVLFFQHSYVKKLSNSVYWKSKIPRVILESFIFSKESKSSWENLIKLIQQSNYRSDAHLCFYPLLKEKGRFTFVLKTFSKERLSKNDVAFFTKNVLAGRFPLLSLHALSLANSKIDSLVHWYERGLK